MTIRIKNWRKFQHYKHRDPPWIKLHRALLDDREWFSLDGDASKMLANCWLLASELDGVLPSLADMAFRLRMTEKAIEAQLSKLNHWVESDASTALADRVRGAVSETETETETECSLPLEITRETITDFPKDAFERFYELYPRKQQRKAAQRAFEKVRKSGEATFAALIAGISKIPIGEPKFVPYPASWLNAGAWDDQISPKINGSHKPESYVP